MTSLYCYDFNALPNDTWEIEVDTCSLKITVDSVGTQIINGDTLKEIFIHDSYGTYSGFFSGSIVETIGNPWYLFPTDFGFFCHGYICDGDFLFGLNCYEDSIIGLYETGLLSSCDTSYNFLDVLIEELPEEPLITIIPNPFKRAIQVKLKEIQNVPYVLSIWSIEGKRILEQKLYEQSTLINVNEFASGLYLLRLQDYKGSIVLRELRMKN